MGLFSGVSEKLFGGNNNSAQKGTERQNQYGMRYTQQQVGQSRSDINGLYDRGDLARNEGYNMMLALTGQAIPTQARYFQGGNVAAQHAILGGQPHIYQAPEINPMAFQHRVPDFGAWEPEYVPILNRPTGWNTQVAGNIGRQGVHADQGLESFYDPAAVLGGTPTGSSGRYQGRFGRYV